MNFDCDEPSMYGSSEILCRYTLCTAKLEESNPFTDIEDDKDELGNEFVLEDC